jgi:Tol biopolymer transport system component
MLWLFGTLAGNGVLAGDGAQGSPAARSPERDQEGPRAIEIWNPCWSADGRILFEASLDGDGVLHLYAISPNGSGLARLHPQGQNPVASPDGSRILFTAKDEGGDLEIYSMAADGSDSRQLTRNEFVDYGPGWTPDGRSVIYNSRSDPKGYVHSLWIMRADGSEPRRLIEGTTNDLSPTVSPDGGRLALVRGEWPQLALWSMNLDGTGARQLADRGFTPEWSRDGRRIVYQGFAGEAPEIFAIEVETGAVTRLTANESDDSMPTWSLDGRQIAFVSDRGGAAGLWVMNADGSGARLVLGAKSP